jgi:hypothetical protein
MSTTCNRLDLQTLGTQPIMSKNPPQWTLTSVLKIEVFKAFQTRFGPLKIYMSQNNLS